VPFGKGWTELALKNQTIGKKKLLLWASSQNPLTGQVESLWNSFEYEVFSKGSRKVE
jgi:hypothetical protein